MKIINLLLYAALIIGIFIMMRPVIESITGILSEIEYFANTVGF